jgi:tRNA G18 (ribose-2'-O)-methylase SpoU
MKGGGCDQQNPVPGPAKRHSFIVDKGESPLLLILDGITDIRNIGAIARSAFCFGGSCHHHPDKGVEH